LSPFAIAGRAHIWARSFGIREPCQVPFNQIWYLGSHACDDSEAGVTWAKLTSKSELIEKSLSNIGNNMARKDARIISAGFGRCDLSMRRKPRRGGPSVLATPLPRRLAEGHAPLSQSGDSRGALLGSRIGMVSCLQLTWRGESDVRAG
jgi:hypothetical protein